MPTFLIDKAVPGRGAYLPFSGQFGSGEIRFFLENDVFIAPKKGTYRVRLWGAGASGSYWHKSSEANPFRASSGSSGGFAMKKIDLDKNQAVQVTVGKGLPNQSGGTSSFGAFVSATGGIINNVFNVGYFEGSGNGVGGDINKNGLNGFCVAGVSQDSIKNDARLTGSISPNVVFDAQEKKNSIKYADFLEFLDSIDFIGMGGEKDSYPYNGAGGGVGQSNSSGGKGGLPAGGGSAFYGSASAGGDGLVVVEICA